MKSRINALLLSLLIVLPIVSQSSRIKIACVGNSITEGAQASDRVHKGYVGQLAVLMGENYDVRNFGVSGATACRDTYKPYDKCERFEEAKASLPDIVTIALGTNDSQPRVWNEGNFAANFEADLTYLCEAFESLSSKPKIYLCLPIPIMPNTNWSHQPKVLSDEIIPLIRKVAVAKDYTVIDLYSALSGHEECYPDMDKLHPNDQGHRLIAETIYSTLSKMKEAKKMKYILLVITLFITAMQSSAAVYDVKNYGAKGDGKQIDSDAINKAIEAASVNGGGTVYLPAGTYLSYSIRMKDNITLYLEAGSVLLAAYPEKDRGYDAAEENEHNKYQDFGHSHWMNSLIWGIDLSDISIEGRGRIDGRGLTREESRLAGVGNKAISLKLCKNVTIKDVQMVNCGHFALLATGVDNMTITNVWVDTNRDGFDIDCCRNVRISDCSVNSPWDDAIVLKSSFALGFFRDTENITITNCYVSGYDKGSVLAGTFERKEPQAPDHGYVTGRIKMGTESSGGFKNISISNCVFENCRGLALESVDGGSLEDIVISNITMRDIVNSPIFLRLGARLRSPKGTPVGKMARITLSNINVYNADSRYASIISGIPDNYIEDVVLDNIRIVYKGGGTNADAKLTPPENEAVYPEPWMFGTIPASGFFIRHARNIEMNNVQISFLSPDFRPSLWLSDVDGCRLFNYRAKIQTGVEPYINSNVTGFEMNMSSISE